MTTIVLSPTHIASDHCVVKRTFPVKVTRELNTPKIFVAPTGKFVIGVSGEFDPELIDKPETWSQLGDILSFVLLELAQNGFGAGGITLDDPDLDLSHFKRVFDTQGKVFMVTKKHRFAAGYDHNQKTMVARELGDYVGIGTGGLIASGLLMGGMGIYDIWKAVHELDTLSSVEHTVFPLSKLKENRAMDQAMRAVRDGTFTVEKKKEDAK